MTRLQLINRVCYTVCIVSILASTCFGLLLVWTNVDPELARKSLLTALIFFLAALMTLGVNRALLSHRSDML